MERIEQLERIAVQAERVLKLQATYFHTPREKVAEKAEALRVSKAAEAELKAMLKALKHGRAVEQGSLAL